MIRRGREKAEVKRGRRGGVLSDIVRDRQLYMMLVPVVAFYILFMYIPMHGLQIAFRDFDIIGGTAASPWVGFDNFRWFFNHPHFFRVLSNTLLLSVYNILWGFPIPIILAILLNEVRVKRLRNTIQTCVLIPHFIAVVIVVGIVLRMLSPGSGVVNSIIMAFGGESIYFMTEPGWFRTVFITMTNWQGAGFASIIYLAAIAGIDQQLYEAAVIDGANKWKQTLHVTLPGIMPTIIILFIMRMGAILEVGFEPVLLLQRPITFSTSDVISTFIFREGLQQGQFSRATAVGFFNSFVGLMLVISANYISKKLTETALW